MIKIILLIIGFAVIIKSADLLVSGASAVARIFRISDLAIGLTVVAMGTSLPELSVNIIAVTKNTPEIAFGNVIGSNIANIFLVLGISAMIFPLAVGKGTVWKEIPMVMLVTLILWALSSDALIDGSANSFLSRIDGIVLLGFLVIFVCYSCSIADTIPGMGLPPVKPSGLAVSLVLVGLGIIGLALGGKLVVDGAVFAARKIGMSETFIGLTLVAVGTSLPELATSAVAAWKKNPEIAVGNVVGSNIFNITGILAASALIRPLSIPQQFNADIGVAVLSSLFLFVFMLTGGKKILDRWEGAILLAAYAGYLTYIIIRG